MAERTSFCDALREEVRRALGLARTLIEKVDLGVFVEHGSPEWQEARSTAARDFLWLSKLTPAERVAARELWSAFERLVARFRNAAKAIDNPEKREPVDVYTDETLAQLERAIHPEFYEMRAHVGERQVAVPEAGPGRPDVRAVLDDGLRGGRLTALDDIETRLQTLIEDIEWNAGALPPPLDEPAWAATSLDRIDEAEGICKRLEGPYSELAEKLPLSEIEGSEVPEYVRLPALTPRKGFAYDVGRRSPKQERALGQVRAGFRKLRSALESIFGRPLGSPGPDDTDGGGLLGDASGFREASIVSRCSEAFYRLGTILPLAEQLPGAYIGHASVKQLRAFNAGRIQFCFDELKEILRELRARAAERVAGHEAHADRAYDENHVFMREGASWRVVFEGKRAMVKHTMGMIAIAALLRRPHKAIPAEELRLVATSFARKTVYGTSTELTDEVAVYQTQKALADLEEKRLNVERSGDEVQLEGITKRIEKLEKQLASTTGLRGRFRLEGDDVEKARVSVTKNVNRALDNIKEAHEPLWRHLYTNIDKGRDFTYKPEKPPVWQVNEG